MIFEKISHLKVLKISKISTFWVAKEGKMAVFETQIWFHVKIFSRRDRDGKMCAETIRDDSRQFEISRFQNFETGETQFLILDFSSRESRPTPIRCPKSVLWNPLPKTGLYGIHCPKWVLWNPLPKTGLCSKNYLGNAGSRAPCTISWAALNNPKTAEK